jgi:hypothetical protein
VRGPLQREVRRPWGLGGGCHGLSSTRVGAEDRTGSEDGTRGTRTPATRHPDRLCYAGPATPAIELEGDQLGELGRDVCHRLFCSAQAASRAEQGADFAESFVRRVVHDGNEQVTR